MLKLTNYPVIILITLLCNAKQGNTHEKLDHIQYLGNEGVMVLAGEKKIIIDPFFHNDYGIYTLVPEPVREAIFSAKAPYDKINLILISHAHGDHFDANDVIKFLNNNPQAKLIAPQQAIDTILELPDAALFSHRMTSVKLDYQDKAKTIQIDNIIVEAVRIPHAGWPGRAAVENMVYRVTLNDKITVMHLGDADPAKQHFITHDLFWKKRITTTALPPYWFYLTTEGQSILDSILNSKNTIGIHVPKQIPDALKNSGKDYFSTPGEIRLLKN